MIQFAHDVCQTFFFGISASNPVCYAEVGLQLLQIVLRQPMSVCQNNNNFCFFQGFSGMPPSQVGREDQGGATSWTRPLKLKSKNPSKQSLVRALKIQPALPRNNFAQMLMTGEVFALKPNMLKSQ